MIQLTVESDPQPRGGGTPATARPEILAAVKSMIAKRMGNRQAEIAAAAAGGD